MVKARKPILRETPCRNQNGRKTIVYLNSGIVNCDSFTPTVKSRIKREDSLTPLVVRGYVNTYANK